MNNRVIPVSLQVISEGPDYMNNTDNDIPDLEANCTNDNNVPIKKPKESLLVLLCIIIAYTSIILLIGVIIYVIFNNGSLEGIDLPKTFIYGIVGFIILFAISLLLKHFSKSENNNRVEDTINSESNTASECDSEVDEDDYNN